MMMIMNAIICNHNPLELGTAHPSPCSDNIIVFIELMGVYITIYNDWYILVYNGIDVHTPMNKSGKWSMHQDHGRP